MNRIFFLLPLVWMAACAGGPAIRQQEYAKLKDHRTFEYEFPEVWKAIEATVRNLRVTERDPEDADPLELKKMAKRTLETDWMYGQSRDKYQEYEVNGTPRKKYLQTRFRYRIIAERVMGGTQVTVKTTEEVERLDASGESRGFESVGDVDTSRPHEILEKIGQALLAAPV